MGRFLVPVFLCVTLGSLHAQPMLTRGPYLQLGGEATMTIVWRTDVAGDGVVEYGMTPEFGSSQASSSGRDVEHVVTLTGLRTDTEYYYRVLNDGTELDRDLFRTFPPTGCSDAFRLLAWGDSGTTPDRDTGLPDANQVAVAEQFGALTPDIAVHTGDLIYNRGEADHFDPRYFVPYQGLVSRVNVYNSLGNHDVLTDNGQPYLDAFHLPSNNPQETERYYSVDYGNVHLVAVDTNQPFDPGSPQFAWLEADLDASNAFWTVVYHHHTPYTAGVSHANDLINEDIRAHLGMLYDFFEVDLVLVGHTHGYERTYPIRDVEVVSRKQDRDYVDPQGTIYITTGGGGRHLNSVAMDHPNNDFQVLYAEEFHATVIDFEGTRLSGMAVSSAGEIIDTFTIAKTRDPVASPAEVDCNGNGLADLCDLSEGRSPDCNVNGVPDECETDCNGNAVPDSCDLAGGGSEDCNENAVPDVCDVAGEVSADVNGNGVPDECDDDCDGDGVLDSLELAGGADDCNSNGVLDECDVAGPSRDINGDGVPDECDEDCDRNGTPDFFQIISGGADCNENDILDACDVAGSSADVNDNGVPDECELDCDADGVPDSFQLAQGASDCNRNGILDVCDVLVPGADDGDGIPDACQSPAAVALAPRPEPVLINSGMRAIAFAGSLAAPGPTDAVWRAATFENVEAGQLADLISGARLFRDTNDSGTFDSPDALIGIAPAAFSGGRIDFAALDVEIPAGGALDFFLVFDVIPADSSRLRLPFPLFTGRWTLLAACIGVLLFAALGLRRHGHYSRCLASSTGLLVLCVGLSLGCSSGGGGGGSGVAGFSDDVETPEAGEDPESPAPSSSRRLQLRLLELEVEKMGGPAGATGVPVTAWSFDA